MVLPDGACLPNICLPGSDVAANVIWLSNGSVEMDSNKSIPGIVIIILGQLAEGERKVNRECGKVMFRRAKRIRHQSKQGLYWTSSVQC